MKLRRLLSDDWRQVLAERKKLIAYAATAALAGLDYGVIPSSARGWILLGILLAGGPVVHQVTNAESKG